MDNTPNEEVKRPRGRPLKNAQERALAASRRLLWAELYLIIILNVWQGVMIPLK